MRSGAGRTNYAPSWDAFKSGRAHTGGGSDGGLVRPERKASCPARTAARGAHCLVGGVSWRRRIRIRMRGERAWQRPCSHSRGKLGRAWAPWLPPLAAPCRVTQLTQLDLPHITYGGGSWPCYTHDGEGGSGEWGGGCGARAEKQRVGRARAHTRTHSHPLRRLLQQRRRPTQRRCRLHWRQVESAVVVRRLTTCCADDRRALIAVARASRGARALAPRLRRVPPQLSRARARCSWARRPWPSRCRRRRRRGRSSASAAATCPVPRGSEEALGGEALGVRRRRVRL